MVDKGSKVYFIFGIHNHQPIGNLPYIFDQAFSSCYLPFLNVLENFPNLKTVIHNSGALYDWAEEKFPEWIGKLKKLSGRGQVELTGGGYYEPIFPIIPLKDCLGQIQLMNRYLKKTFGVFPKGCWVPERVWEPSLVKTLSLCGLKYAYLDEANFFQKPTGVSGPCLAQEREHSVGLFAINELLVEKIPFVMPEVVVDILLSYQKDKDVLVTFFCDGEKFGLWPGTYESVYRQKWLERFFTLLEGNSRVETIFPEAAFDKFSKKEIVHIGSSTYPKMKKWSGGSFDNFFVKYPRLNFMHKRMLWVSERVNSSLGWEKDKNAFLDLWKAQANCVYWHGLYGGFYLPHLRKSCYSYLAKAEAALLRNDTSKLIKKDVDFDGYQEIVWSLPGKTYVFSSKGGSLDELSLREVPLNLINTIDRVKESYHSQYKSHSFLPERLTYDAYKKTAFVDHLCLKNLSLEQFQKGIGLNSLAAEPYQFSAKSSREEAVIDFSYKGKGLGFMKKAVASKTGLKVTYQLDEKNTLNNSLFGIECNLSLSSPEKLELEGFDKNRFDFSKAQDLGGVNSLLFVDKEYRLKLRFSFNWLRVYSNPIYTLSSSESGKDILFQQLSLLFMPNPGEENFFINLDIEKY